MLERVDKLLKRLIYLSFGDIQWEDPGRRRGISQETPQNLLWTAHES